MQSLLNGLCDIQVSDNSILISRKKMRMSKQKWTFGNHNVYGTLNTSMEPVYITLCGKKANITLYYKQCD